MGSGVSLRVWTPGKVFLAPGANATGARNRIEQGPQGNRHYDRAILAALIRLERFAPAPGTIPKDPAQGVLLSVRRPATHEAYASGHTGSVRKSGQAGRPISTSPLNTLLCLHAWPINLVVFKGSDREN